MNEWKGKSRSQAHGVLFAAASLNGDEWVFDESRACTCFNPRRALINTEDTLCHKSATTATVQTLTKWL